MGLGMVSLLIPSVNILTSGSSLLDKIPFPSPIGDITLLIDPLSAFFVAVISVMSFLSSLYAIGYLKPYLEQKKSTASHIFFLNTLVASMLLVVTVQNALFFLIVWEIMSLSSFFLVIFESEKKEVMSAGLQYLVTMHVSVLFIMAGFILLSNKSGSFDFNTFKVSSTVFMLFFVGFGIKAGFVPFHIWLPQAHPAAPTHVSGMMSGVMIKTGMYGILRMLLIMGMPTLSISYFVLAISVITALFGILYAVAQHDIKKLLAYSSVENIGIIGIGIGVGMLGLAYHNDLMAFLGFAGAIFHILNHSIFKSLMFFGAGSVYQRTHTRNMEKLGGLVKIMPYTAVLFLIGSLAITGLPPLNGFISEFLIYLGMLHSFQVHQPLVLITLALGAASLALVGTLALLCFTKMFSIVFLGSPRSEKIAGMVKGDVPVVMIIPMCVLALFPIIIGIFPQHIFYLLKTIIRSFVGDQQLATATGPYMNILGNISIGCLSFILLVVLIYGVRTILIRNKSVYQHNTWACGYNNVNERMQYSASSYVGLFLSFLTPFFIKRFNIRKPKETFPKEARFEMRVYDIIEFYLIHPLVKTNKKFLALFHWIQSGSTQQYILYGLIFLILALIGAMRL
jgi:formate hydrogenlyase subunit 3/multisubunit Na+/H+ antiporter MnhD subunit